MGCSPSGTGCSSAGLPMGSQALPANLLWHGLLFPQVRRSWQEPAPAQASQGVTVSFRHPPAPAWGTFHRLQVDICSTMDLHGLEGDKLPHRGLHHELQEKTLCSSVLSTSSPSFFTDLGAAELFLSHRLAPLSRLPFYRNFFPLLKYVITEALTTVADCLGLGQRQVCIRAGWHWLYQMWGKLLAAPHRSHPYSTPTTKTLPRKPIKSIY